MTRKRHGVVSSTRALAANTVNTGLRHSSSQRQFSNSLTDCMPTEPLASGAIQSTIRIDYQKENSYEHKRIHSSLKGNLSQPATRAATIFMSKAGYRSE